MKFKRIVIKVGTSTLTDGQGLIDRSYLRSLVGQIAHLLSKKTEVVLVSSGAIRAGMEKLGLAERPKTIPENQAAAAVGQGLLMQTYSEIFSEHGLATGQVLLTREDFGDRKRYLNARNTMLTLLRRGVVPIVNENDTVAVEEIRVGDNDHLAAVVASNIEADMLILLSDVEGLYDSPKGGRLIPSVTRIDDSVRSVAGETSGINGTGGMRTKIEAAEIAVKSGVRMVIADGRRESVVTDLAAGKQIGTSFLPKEERLCGRKRWIAFGAASRGGIIINEGAR